MTREDLAALLPDLRAGLLRYAITLTGSGTAAEDLVQETMVRALERSESLVEPGALRSWLYRIAHNLAVDQFRRDREYPTEDIGDLVEERWRDDAYTVDAGAVALAAETAEELQDALLRLPTGYRTVLVLHDAHGWTAREIAESLDLGLPATKQRLRRARMMLVSALAAGQERRVAIGTVPLRCWDARRQVSAYLDHELDAAVARAVEAHLAGCPTCPPLYASLVSAQENLSRLGELRDPDSVVPPDVASRLSGH